MMPNNDNNGQPVVYKQSAEGKKSSGTGKLILGIVIGFLLAVTVGASGAVAYKMLDVKKTADVPSLAQTEKPDDANDKVINEIVDNYQSSPKTDITVPMGGNVKLSYAQIAEKVQPSVCTVIAYYYTAAISSGSGIILSEDGYIVTNAHVVTEEKYDKLKITVKVFGKEGEYDAKVIGCDEKADVALIKINVEGLVPAVIGDSDSLVVGDEVVAIGTPLDEAYAGTVTNGIISGLNRTIDSSDIAAKYIQTNAAINPGNSGGALVNMYGQVIGINTAKIVLEGYEGMGFSIPMASTLDIISDLKLYGKVTRPALGITCRSVIKSEALYYNIPQGVIIRSVARNSSLAGKVRIGDIITKMNGIEVTDIVSLQEVLNQCTVGQSIPVELYRPKDGSNEAMSYTIEIVLLGDGDITYDDAITSNDD